MHGLGTLIICICASTKRVWSVHYASASIMGYSIHRLMSSLSIAISSSTHRKIGETPIIPVWHLLVYIHTSSNFIQFIFIGPFFIYWISTFVIFLSVKFRQIIVNLWYSLIILHSIMPRMISPQESTNNTKIISICSSLRVHRGSPCTHHSQWPGWPCIAGAASRSASRPS